ncbi:MAG: hypothetical protein KIS68_06330 [Bauldia sp.]|nr:hypothetical protein [Bauldia sp.]
MTFRKIAAVPGGVLPLALSRPPWVKTRLVALATLLVGVVVFSTVARAQFALPEPTGPSAVGVTYIHLADDARTDPFRSEVTVPRELTVKAYYPADPASTAPLAPYFGGFIEHLRASIAFYQLPWEPFAPLAEAVTHSRTDAALSDEAARYPLILFSPGAGTTMEMHTAQAEDFASHGYIVLAIDHPYLAGAVRLPDRIVLATEATRPFDVPEPAVPLTRIMADDVSFVISELQRLDGGIDARFAGRIDLDAVGVMGHSVGGAVAYNLAINDSRVRAAVDLDGVVFTTPGEASAAMAPFLMIANDRHTVQAIAGRQNLRFAAAPDDVPAADREMVFGTAGGEAAYRAAYADEQAFIGGLADVLGRSETLFAVTGSDHMKFSDIGLYAALPGLGGLPIGGETDAARVLAVSDALVLAFFNEHLRGAPPGGIDAVLAATPELRRIDLTP